MLSLTQAPTPLGCVDHEASPAGRPRRLTELLKPGLRLCRTEQLSPPAVA
jgi:hypothetical protein